MTISNSLISNVNLSEVLGRFSRDGHDPAGVLQRLVDLGLIPTDFDADTALLAAAIRPKTDPLGLSLGDRACLACTIRGGWPLLTADRAWGGLDVGVDIRLIR